MSLNEEPDKTTVEQHRSQFRKVLDAAEKNMPGRTDFHGVGAYGFGRTATVAKLSLLRLLPGLAQFQRRMRDKGHSSTCPLIFGNFSLHPQQANCGRHMMVVKFDGTTCLRVDFDHFSELYKEISVRQVTDETVTDDDAPIILSAGTGRTNQDKGWEYHTGFMDRRNLDASVLFFELCRHLDVPVSNHRFRLGTTFFDNFENLIEADGLPGTTFETVMRSIERDTAAAMLRNLPGKIASIADDLSAAGVQWGGSHLATRDGLSASSWKTDLGDIGIIIEVENPKTEPKGLVISYNPKSDGEGGFDFYAFADNESSADASMIADYLQVRAARSHLPSPVKPCLSFRDRKSADTYMALPNEQMLLEHAPELLERVAFAAHDVRLRKSRSRVGRIETEVPMFASGGDFKDALPPGGFGC